MKGNEAFAESCLRAGCRFFSGYPITPQTEILEYMSWRMEQVGGQLADWNFELRGAQSWIADEDRWDYNEVKVHLPNGNYKFEV